MIRDINREVKYRCEYRLESGKQNDGGKVVSRILRGRKRKIT